MNVYVNSTIKNGKPGYTYPNEKVFYANAELNFRAKFISHGNVAGHAIPNGLVNVTTPTRDEEAGHLKGRHLNDGFIRAMCFTLVEQHIHSRDYVMWKRTGVNRLPKGFSLQELYQGIIYVYDKETIMQLITLGKAEYYHLTKHSKTHKDYWNPNEELREIWVKDRADVPEPLYIMIGNIGCKLQKEDRIDVWTDLFPKIKIKHPTTDIIYFEECGLYKSKPNDITGNTLTSKHGAQVIDFLMKVYEKKVTPMRII